MIGLDHTVFRFRMRLVLCLCSMACLVGASEAEEKCGTEIKLLLLPTELHLALKSLKAERRTTGSVYFFDTNTLELLSEGLILRVRSGAASDLTVKLRLPTNLEARDGFRGSDHEKCEIDLTGEQALRSYSIRTKFAGNPPKAGQELFELLSAPQKRLLEQAHVSLDWTRIERIGEIKSTEWEIKSQSHFPKLMLELWDWRTGEILELSTKVAADTGPSAYAQLRQIALNKGLSLNRDQKPKTALALEDISRNSRNSSSSLLKKEPR